MFSFLESDGLVSVCANLSVSGAAMSDSVLTVTLNRTDGKSNNISLKVPQ